MNINVVCFVETYCVVSNSMNFIILYHMLTKNVNKWASGKEKKIINNLKYLNG